MLGLVFGGVRGVKRFNGMFGMVLLGIFMLPAPAFTQSDDALETAEDAADARASGASEEQYNSLDSFYTLYQPYMNNISAYQPIYFLPGIDLEESKVQISFKYRAFNPEGSFAGKYPWLAGWYFGYTQTSFWNLESDSLPFEDTSYKPELFHLTQNLFDGSSAMRGLFFKSGLFHESNGKQDEDSRGINTAYLQSVLVFYNPDNRYGLSIAPKVWGYFSTGDENADIADYRGYFDVDVKVGRSDGVVLSSLFSWAKEGGSVQVDLTYPVGEWLFDNINLYLHLQYVNTLAENLLFYKERTEACRIGVSFVR